ncbi:MAG: hypothetical protein O3C21_07180 [Verrucomicrobia bacterium]|nr:hypothetical protein [Verrucomicrobiota bacterium]
MRHTNAIPWIFTSLAAIALGASATAEVTIGTIQTIEGENYANAKILNVESDGVIVKHSKGIAKIPFYELDDATRRAVGHTGEVVPPIRHSAPPETGLLPDIAGHGVESSDLDLDAAPAITKENDKVVPVASGKPEVRSAAVRTTKRIMRKAVPVGVSAVGVSSKFNTSTARVQKESHGTQCCGCGAYPTITTRYTPYGNFSYVGEPTHWYGYYNPPCNRCHFERTAQRRWQGRR